MSGLDTSGTLGRYVRFQIPGWGLAAIALWYGVDREWLAARTAVWIWIAWALKDFLLYPALRSAYTPDRDDPGAGLRGRRGTARDALGHAPREGFVAVGPELWRAVLAEDSAPVGAGDPVRVREVRGLQLVVERIGE